MRFLILIVWFPLSFLLLACKKENNATTPPVNNAYQVTRQITYNDISVDLVIDKPANDEVDVLIIYHGTVSSDSLILNAARNALNVFKRILEREDMMLISVAYPQEHLLFGDNIRQAEAALLWVKNMADAELDIRVNKVFIAGHSQGGYIVTRLNTMHQTNGVIANAPGPLNLVFRCRLEEDGRVPAGRECGLLFETYGSAFTNPGAYFERSLFNFTNGFKSDILFVQGLDDSPIQMHLWPEFKQRMNDCNTCQGIQLVEQPGYGHAALFESSRAKNDFNTFIDSR